MTGLQYAAMALIVIGTIGVFSQAVSLTREIRFLRSTLFRLVPSGRITEKGHLVSLKSFLSETISYDRSKRDAKRPLLRHLPSHILRTEYGFCGENARCAIVLLGLGGVRAHRLYLEGARFDHVALELFWGEDWFLFDAHRDPKTLLPDDRVAEINSDALSEFPNGYPENPWVRSFRIKLFHRLPPLNRWEMRRVPGWVAMAAELPPVIKMVMWSMPVMMGGMLWVWQAIS